MVVGAAEEVVAALTGLLAGGHAALAGGRLRVGVGSTGGHGVNGLLRSADSRRVVNDLDLHVSLVSPVGTPRVSHDPVLNSVFGSVSNHTDGVVEAGSTRGRVHDSRFV